jgi:hypothetical protein
VRHALAEQVAEDIADAPANYSILHEDGTGRARGLYLLYRSSMVVGRYRSAKDAVAALVPHLASHRLDQRDDLVLVRAWPWVGRDGVVVLPQIMLANCAALEPRLRRAGYRVTGWPWVAIDPATGEAVVESPSLNGGGDDAERHTITAWLVFQPWPLRGEPSPAQQLTAVVPDIVNLSNTGAETAMAAIAAVLDRARVAPIASLEPRDVIAALGTAN